jgi:hypothetical protein
MFDGSMQVDAGEMSGGRAAWRDVDRQLRVVAKRRGALDHEELQLIRKAIVLALWRELGMTSMREYLEHVMGYGPNVASERIRVAEALGAMPALEAALDTGELSYSAVRAITRIATRKTEGQWVAACRGKNQRQIEELLAEREAGDRPDDPRNPDLRLHSVTYRIPPHVVAMLRQCRTALESEMGQRVDDADIIEAMGIAFLRGGSAAARKAPNQISYSVCPACQVARQGGAGVDVAVSPAVLERAACDAQWLGNVDGPRARAVQDVTPAVRKLVLARDRHRCRVPGCRSARNIDVHHIIHRWQGGSHEPRNLIALCCGHHAAHHEGHLIIRGTADTLEVARVGAGEPENFHGENADAKASETAQMRADATLALTGLGFTKREATRAVSEALGEDAPRDLEALIRGALRRCSS